MPSSTSERVAPSAATPGRSGRYAPQAPRATRPSYVHDFFGVRLVNVFGFSAVIDFP
jgi:hypothetical protein